MQISLIWNMQLVQIIADYFVQATLHQLINLVSVTSACSVVVVGGGG